MRIFSKRPLAVASLLFILSSLTVFLLNRSGISCLWALFPFLFFFLLFLFLSVAKRQARFLLLLLLSLCPLLGLLTQHLYDNRAQRPWREAEGGVRHSIVATVEATESINGKDVCYSVSVRELDGNAARFRLLLFTEYNGHTPLAPYTRVATEVFLRECATPRLYTRGIAGSATADGTPLVLTVDTESPAARLSALRSTLTARIREGLTGDTASLYCALFLGDRTALSDSVTSSFQRSGTSHLLALSGLHLSVLALFLLRILRLLGVPNTVSFPLFLLFLLLYTGVAGFPLSLMRAALMMVIYRLALLCRLFADSFTSLTFAVALILLVSPASATDVGLYLSFLATLGLLVANELSRGASKRRGRLLSLARAFLFALLSSLLAILFTLLLSVLTFGKFSLIAIPANLLLSPIVSLCLLLAPLLLLFPNALGPVADWMGEIALRLASRLSDIPGSYVFATYPVFLLALLLFSLYLVFLLAGKERTRKALFLHFSVAFALLALVFCGCHTYTKSTDVLLYARSVQHEYITVRSEGKVTVVANTSESSSLSALEKALSDAYIAEIDTLILTHCDDGVAEFLEDIGARLMPRSILLLPPTEEDDPYYREALLAAEYLRLPLKPIDPSAIQLDGLRIELEQIPKTAESAHTGILLSIRHPAAEIRFASPNVLSSQADEKRQEFLSDADLLILGAHPKAGSGETLFTLPKDCYLLTAHPQNLPEGLVIDEKILIKEPAFFSYRLK